ncbi:hypothetical protein CCUS01_15178 [Colletotrichum cuscutae]|uniref:Uncharacterized protein n=1 Tax=Colletotrichum cuscutae TaxID=1209917 RepID=A0AAI9VGL8_9PEZI|nr:hypothetical protein CCUS01_15178 [Colletotrichum cuscutae]
MAQQGGTYRSTQGMFSSCHSYSIEKPFVKERSSPNPPTQSRCDEREGSEEDWEIIRGFHSSFDLQLGWGKWKFSALSWERQDTGRNSVADGGKEDDKGCQILQSHSTPRIWSAWKLVYLLYLHYIVRLCEFKFTLLITKIEFDRFLDSKSRCPSSLWAVNFDKTTSPPLDFRLSVKWLRIPRLVFPTRTPRVLERQENNHFSMRTQGQTNRISIQQKSKLGLWKYSFHRTQEAAANRHNQI